MRTNTKLGATLRALRIVCHRPQIEIAQEAGLSAATLSNIENGWREPRQDELRRILKALGVDVDVPHLLDGA